MYINCTFGKWNILIKNTNYEKTDKLNFNSTIKFSNDLLNDKQILKNDWKSIWFTELD
jgi:hypothetical protein